jgi:hypothetical protein
MSRLFDTSFARRDHDQRENHGRFWDERQYTKLRQMFLDGHELPVLAKAMGRSGDSIVSNLTQRLGLIRCATEGSLLYEWTDKALRLLHEQTPTETQPNPQPEIIDMSNTNTNTSPTIETKTFIGGVDAAKLSDSDIFSRIADLEVEIKKWSAIEQRPKKLNDHIDKMRSDVKALGEFVDSRG